MLLVPVYTFEHHLVWTLPGLVAITAATAAQTHESLHLEGRNRESQRVWQAWVWRGSLVLTWLLLAAPLLHLRKLLALAHDHPLLSGVLRETKFVGLVVLLAMCVYLVRRAPAAA
jgi:hypothetical protein